MADDATQMRKGSSKVITQEDKKLLSERVQLLKHKNAVLLQENSMFERFLSRLDPRVFEPQEGEDLGEMGVSPIELTLEQKCYVAQREREETLKDLEKITQENKVNQDVAESQLAELRKARNEFERDVAIPLREKIGVVGADRVLRYFENKKRAKDTELLKLGQKNMVLKTQVSKLQLQLRQKAQTDEDMTTELDFQLLKIENGKCLELIDEQNQELSQLKLLAANKQQALNSYKNKLQNTTYESEQLSSDITNRMQMLEKMEKEFLQVEEERSKAEVLTRKLRSQVGTDVPEILDYIQVLDKHSKLECSVRTMERKVKIAEMVLKTQRRDKRRAVVAAVDVDTSSHSAGPGPAQLKKTSAKAWSKQGAAATSSHHHGHHGAGAGARAGEDGQLKLP